MKKFFIYCLCLNFLVILSCNDGYDPKPNNYSKLLTGENKKTWLLTGVQFREDGKPLESWEVPPDDCAFDDLYIFYANDERRFEIDEGPTKCDPADAQIFLTDTWAIVNATATLEFVVPVLLPFKLPYIIHELTETKLQVEIYFNEEKHSYRMVFKSVSSE